MYEELLTEDEKNAMEKTAHGRIFKAHPDPINGEEFLTKLKELKKLSDMNSGAIVDCIREIVPNFRNEKEEKEEKEEITA